MATAVTCDKCGNLIAGKVYGGNGMQRIFGGRVEANGLGELQINNDGIP